VATACSPRFNRAVHHVLLGRTGLRVSRLALGTTVLGVAPPESEVDALVHAALDVGVNLFDCANTYGNRRSFDREGLPTAAARKHAEELLGRALRGRRDEVVLCTKVSEPVGDGPNDGGLVMPGSTGKGGGLSRYHIMREVEHSLRRLGTDHIDIYHLHHPDPDTAIDETLRAADDLVRQGKVRYVALSTFAGWQLAQAALTAERDGLTRPILNQVPYNLVNRAVESEVVPAALALGLAITCFSPLAGGALAGAEVMARPYSGYRRWGVPFDYTPEQRSAATQLDEVAHRWGHTPAQLALHWLLSRPAVAAAIVGPENPDELAKNLTAFDVELDPDQLAELDAIGRDVPGMPI
jgi:1-deoxyxylulose-5-phosphate synthase